MDTGALPVPGVSGRRILELCPQAASLLQAAEALEGSEQVGFVNAYTCCYASLWHAPC